MNMPKITIKASARLKQTMPVFAADHKDAGQALKAIGAILGGNFVTDEDPEGQCCIWRTSKFLAKLCLNKDGSMEFDFKDKGNAGSFSAEGHTVHDLLHDIKYNVTEFQPTRQLDPQIKSLRDGFEAIQ